MEKVEKVKTRKGTKFYGDIPVNSRVTVDYSGKKPLVSFGYPSKEVHSIDWSGAVVIPAFIILMLFIGLLWSLCYTPTAPQQCLVDNYYSNLTEKEYLLGINCTMDNGENLYFKYSDSEVPFIKGSFAVNIDIAAVFFLICAVGGFYAGMLISIWLVGLLYHKTRWGKKVYPVANKITSIKRWSATFKKCPVNNIIEIPLFANVFLDYRATKEFSKYLQRVEIREHPFMEYVKKKKKKNIWLWKAQFIFSKNPKKGKLEAKWD